VDLQYYQNIAQKVLEGAASNEEKAELQAFMEVHEHNPAIIQALFPLQELENMPEQPLPADMEERVLANILARPAAGRRKVRIAYLGRIAVAAAVVFFACLILYRWTRFGKPATPVTPQYVSVFTRPGEHKRITLPDSSQISLNGNSHVLFPQNFTPASREVYLEGEAFFTVSRDEHRPFIVHAAAISTTVLGTSFNVRCFSQEKLSQVAVATGKVKVALNSSVGGSYPPVEVMPGQRVSYHLHDAAGLQKDYMDIAAVGAWKERSFYYDQTPLRQILADLESVYGLRFKILDTALLHCTYTARFRNLSATGILQTLGTLGQVQFTQKDTIITVSGKPCQ
jgi:ferric-dicitrate binding protein FerR (iron transport regulator)